MLLDNSGDPDLRTLEMMAKEAIKRGWQGRALAHHCRAMSAYPDRYLSELLPVLRQAGVTIVSDPHTGPLHARIPELLAAGINVCLGQDDISDAYYPFGRNNMLEVAFLAAHLLWMMSRKDMETLYDMVTVRPAEALHIPRLWHRGWRARQPRRLGSAGYRRGAALSRPAARRDQSRPIGRSRADERIGVRGRLTTPIRVAATINP